MTNEVHSNIQDNREQEHVSGSVCSTAEEKRRLLSFVELLISIDKRINEEKKDCRGHQQDTGKDHKA